MRGETKKVQAIIDMASPQTLKELQSLNGKLAALNRFLSKSAERALPFFKALKEGIRHGGKITWTEAAEQAFLSLKAYLHTLPTLTTPNPGERLYLYLAATTEALSAVLLRDENGVQCPVYWSTTSTNFCKGPSNGIRRLRESVISVSSMLQCGVSPKPIL